MEKFDKELIFREDGDEALFQALKRSRRRRRRKALLIVLSIVLVLGAAAFFTVKHLQQRVREEFASSAAEVLSAEVTTGSVSTVVSGSGSLTDVDLLEVSVPEGVQITQVAVRTNEAVQPGDVLAYVDMSTVMTALAQVQSSIEALDDQISQAEEDEAEDTVCAGVTGRVKAIFAQEGDAVADVMVNHGALALLSLDGYMAVQVQTDALAEGDAVTVVLAEEDTLAGTVESVSGQLATILVTDKGTGYQEEVTVLDSRQECLGTGTLYIHSPLAVTAYAGTVEDVLVKVNEKVSDDEALLELEDTAYSANYETLLRQRAQKEQQLLELLTIRRDGAVLSKSAGSIYSVDWEEDGTDVVTVSADEKMSVTISVDEGDILALELGQTVEVTVSSVSEEAFQGVLTQIDRTGGSSGSYSALVELSKESGMLSGMTAAVSVRIEGVDDALIIPVEALHETRDGAYVYTAYDELTQTYGGRVDVVTGLENSTYVQIKSGLSLGDTVYYTQEQNSFGNRNSSGDRGQMPNMGQMSDGGNQRPGGQSSDRGNRGRE